MKKVLYIDLEKKPENFEEFIEVIEKYCIKEKISYEFLDMDKPAILMMNGKKTSCNLERVNHHMGRSWFLKFTEE